MGAGAHGRMISGEAEEACETGCVAGAPSESLRHLIESSSSSSLTRSASSLGAPGKRSQDDLIGEVRLDDEVVLTHRPKKHDAAPPPPPFVSISAESLPPPLDDERGALGRDVVGAGLPEAGSLESGMPRSGALESGEQQSVALERTALECATLECAALERTTLECEALECGAPASSVESLSSLVVRRCSLASAAEESAKEDATQMAAGLAARGEESTDMERGIDGAESIKVGESIKVAGSIKMAEGVEDDARAQVELLQGEVDVLQEKLAAALQSGAEMRAMLGEYELTMEQMIRARNGTPPTTLRCPPDDNVEGGGEDGRERRQLAVDLRAMTIAFANCKERYEEARHIVEKVRAHEEGLKANISALQTELASGARRYDELRRHAEGKLCEANEELFTLKSTLEIELSSTRAKLHKAELRISSLEGALEGKTRENGELMAICDDLIQKIDLQAASMQGGSAAASSAAQRSTSLLASLNQARPAP